MYMYWLLVLFSALLLGGMSAEQEGVHQDIVLQEQARTMEAIQMVRYMNNINDWRYLNPGVDNISITDTQLTGWKNVPGLSNLISGGRCYVWRTNEPGLMAALLVQTRQSALVGRVVSRRLVDGAGADMQFTVPSAIPDGSVVWVN